MSSTKHVLSTPTTLRCPSCQTQGWVFMENRVRSCAKSAASGTIADYLCLYSTVPVYLREKAAPNTTVTATTSEFARQTETGTLQCLPAPFHNQVLHPSLTPQNVRRPHSVALCRLADRSPPRASSATTVIKVLARSLHLSLYSTMRLTLPTSHTRL